MNSMVASIRHDGILKIAPDFKQTSLQIYLEENTSTAEYIKILDARFGSSIDASVDIDKAFAEDMGSYARIVSKLGVGMIVVTVFVVILILYFVINSSIIRQKQKLGIQKAIGFTTFQLMNQLSIGFLPPIITGVFIGSILGMLETNTMISIVSKSMGVMKANFIITPGWIALFGIAIVLVSYMTSMLITYKIRKISAYALVSE